MILDIQQREGANVKYLSPFKLLQNKIQEAVNKRANAAFEPLSISKKGLDELQ